MTFVLNLRSLVSSLIRCSVRSIVLILRHSRNSAAIFQVFGWDRNVAVVVNSCISRIIAVNLPRAIIVLNNNRANWLLWTVKRIWLNRDFNRGDGGVGWRSDSYVSIALLSACIVRRNGDSRSIWFCSNGYFYWSAFVITLAWNKLELCVRVLMRNINCKAAIFTYSDSYFFIAILQCVAIAVLNLDSGIRSSLTSNSGLIRLSWRVFSIAIVDKWRVLCHNVYCYFYIHRICNTWNIYNDSALLASSCFGIWRTIFASCPSKCGSLR